MIRYLEGEVQRIAQVDFAALAASLDEEADALAAAAAASVAASDLEGGSSLSASSASSPPVYQIDKVEQTLQKVYGQFLRFSSNDHQLQQQKLASVSRCFP